MMKKMNILVASLMILISGITCSMEPEVASKETTLETVAGPESRGSWVSFFEEILPGYSSPETGLPPSSRISQNIAQEVLRKMPQVRKFIFSRIERPNKECFRDPCLVYSAAFNPTGDRVVTASRDSLAELWDTETGELLFILESKTRETGTPGLPLLIQEGHGGAVYSAAFNLTSDRVVTASGDTTARIWDTETGKPLCILKGHTGPLLSAAFNSTSDRVVTASADRTARIWDVETGRTLSILDGHTDTVIAAEFSPRGDKVVTASGDNKARIWNAATGKLLLILKDHVNWLNSAMFNSTGDRAVTTSADATAKLWDTETGELLHTLRDHRSQVRSAVFSPTGDSVLTASEDGTAIIWDTADGSLLLTLEGHTERLVSAAFNVTGDRVVTASAQRMARIWYLSSFLESKRFLSEDITLQQVALLLDLIEAKNAGSMFDFNSYPQDKYPYLWNDYEKLPKAMRNMFDPYVTKLTPEQKS